MRRLRGSSHGRRSSPLGVSSSKIEPPMTTAFNLARLNISWTPVLPLLIIAVAAMAILLIGVRIDDEDSEGLGWLTLASMAIALVLSLTLLGRQESTFGGA